MPAARDSLERESVGGSRSNMAALRLPDLDADSPVEWQGYACELQYRLGRGINISRLPGQPGAGSLRPQQPSPEPSINSRLGGLIRQIGTIPRFCRRVMVLPVGIEPTTSPLPRGCSTTELRQHPV